MAVIQDNASGTLATVGATQQALRVAKRTQEHGNRGAYRAGFYTGVIAAGLGANSELFQFRFVTGGTLLAVIRRIRAMAAVSTTAFVAGVPATLESRIARAWTAQGTGGTGITWGTNDGKKRTSQATTILGAGDVRIATTAALGAGTKTLDGTAFGQGLWQPGAALIASPVLSLYERDESDEYPLVLGNQEGFVVRSVEVPATGTWKLAVDVEWTEVDSTLVLGWS